MIIIDDFIQDEELHSKIQKDEDFWKKDIDGGVVGGLVMFLCKPDMS